MKPEKYSIGFRCSLYPGMRYPMPSTACGTALLIAARTCSSFGRSTSDCAAMYSSTDFGTLCFISLILCLGMRFFLAVIRLASSFSGDTFHTGSAWGAQLGRVAITVFCKPCPAAARQARLTTLEQNGLSALPTGETEHS